jgi:uncharacterized protein
VKDPREVVRAGQTVKVRVVEVDVPRKRIALTMKSPDAAARGGAPRPAGGARPPDTRSAPPPPRTPPPSPKITEGIMADALRRARR